MFSTFLHLKHMFYQIRKTLFCHNHATSKKYIFINNALHIYVCSYILSMLNTIIVIVRKYFKLVNTKCVSLVLNRETLYQMHKFNSQTNSHNTRTLRRTRIIILYCTLLLVIIILYGTLLLVSVQCTLLLVIICN